jgi:hypothetical protein
MTSVDYEGSLKRLTLVLSKPGTKPVLAVRETARWNELAYGVWVEENGLVLFNRHYHPIWRKMREGTWRRPLDRAELVKWHKQHWFYSGIHTETQKVFRALAAMHLLGFSIPRAELSYDTEASIWMTMKILWLEEPELFEDLTIDAQILHHRWFDATLPRGPVIAIPEALR